MTAYAYVFIGLTITSSWGNGHATTYRALLRALSQRGHEVLFLERDLPYYAPHRDLARAPYARVEIYRDLADLKRRFSRAVRDADLVVVGSYVPEGVAVNEWVLDLAPGRAAFYDIDTPVTLAALDRGDEAYVARAQVPRFDLYLSFTGGPTLDRLRDHFGARRVRPLYCSVDPEAHAPERAERRWDLGYLGTYAEDRQPVLERLLIEPARRLPEARFVVAGAQYPPLAWPANVERRDHVAPSDHRLFYASQRFSLNITRRDMALAGHSPSVRLFEAGPVVADHRHAAGRGLDALFTPGREILVARGEDDVARFLSEIDEPERRAIGERARARTLAAHTAAHRAEALTAFTTEIRGSRPRPLAHDPAEDTDDS